MEHSTQQYVSTTKAVLPLYSEQPTIVIASPPITLRPMRVSDLSSLHELRTQSEVMYWTSTGKVDVDLNATRTWMARFISMEDGLQASDEDEVPAKIRDVSSGPQNYNLVIVYRESAGGNGQAQAADEKSIGVVGCHNVYGPQPECGYMILKEYWSRGVATAALRSYLESWWRLERSNAKIPYQPQVHKSIQPPSGDKDPNDDTDVIGSVPEIVDAVIESSNTGSRKVLQKCGFTYSWSENVPDNHSDGEVVLEHYMLPRPI